MAPQHSRHEGYGEQAQHAERVFKYRLPSLNEEPFVEMPKGAELLDVAAQDGIPYVWARIHPGQPTVRRYMRVYATGEPIDGYPEYVGTFRIDWTVWHVFASRQEHPLEAAHFASHQRVEGDS